MRSQTAVLLISFTVLTPALAQAPQRMYKCVDARGKVYYTQVPPRECLGRETTELNKSGSVIKKSERAPTPAEVQAREAERKKKAEADERAKEERRKNTALLNTYSSEKDIEDQRARALKEAQDAIAATEKSIAGAQKRQKDLEAEKEFYVKKPMPFKLKNEINNVEMEIKNQTTLLEAKKKEITHINAKYDEDKRRYVELTAAKK
jgi:chromosome segregation ATPase